MSENLKSENYKSFAEDGAWCWYSDPRAIYYEGKFKRTYAAWVSSNGDIVIGYYDHDTEQRKSSVLEKNFEIDDHDVPAILVSPEGKLLVFFSKHSTNEPILLFTSKMNEDISKWEKQELILNDAEEYKGLHHSYTYANPVMLPNENNRIYLFWRGMDYKPNYSFSDDLGKTWSKGRIYILPERVYNMRRPYVKIISNNQDRIAFAFTDGHPRNEKENSIYYMYYKDGWFYNVNNTKIGKMGEEPIQPRDASVVYDAKITEQKAWIWDVALDDNDNPVITFAKFPDDSTHIYSYAIWNEKKWIIHDLINSGKWFPETDQGTKEREPNYSGGIAIDKENIKTVYLSVARDSIFEIEKWKIINEDSWEIEKITSGSSKDNVRPYPIYNARKENSLQVLWMRNTYYKHYTDYLSSIKMNIK